MDLKNRRWLLLIVMPAIISIILMHYFSIFETSIFRTLGNDSITYRTPWERPRYFIVNYIHRKYLTDKEINAVLLRKDLMLKVIDERIKKLGEDEVLY